MERQIHQIFKDELNEEIVNITDVSKGVDQIVKIVQTKKSIYVIKLPKKDVVELLQREFIGCQKLKGIVPVPNIVIKSNQYIIEEFISGEDLDEASLSITSKKKIYNDLGKNLKKIASVKMEGFGYVDIKGKGSCSTLRERVLYNREKNLSLLKNNFLSKEENEKLLNYLEKNDFYADSKESVMLHFDFEDWNIKIQNEIIIGILDFGDLSTGPKAWDLARPFISHYFDGMFNYILDGYGKIDLDEVKYFVIVTLLGLISYHNDMGDLKEIELKLKILKEII